ncbi:keratin, type II microfibrillar, component 7C-like isoform X2 [Tachyglossus aculeatus]|uniref:keratin, type II microfibrillar, component 7C-like isoform X2 n=1 Tax=Tachyglossus aculeatus TaxID=9261 RepID=UPI0018F4642C|nr:keratin, type II microfibrillar, component 7C-like isoform X2 [Tachyglossus aculeatus]
MSLCEEVKPAVRQHGEKLRCSKEELNQMNRTIQRLSAEYRNARNQMGRPELTEAQVEHQGKVSLRNAHTKLAGLAEALQKAKRDMACLLKEYQEIINSKLGLDIAMATYQLLEDEESLQSEGSGAENISMSRSRGREVRRSLPSSSFGVQYRSGSGCSSGTPCGPGSCRRLGRRC